MRSVVDLLKPDKLDFRVTGSLGPFNVKLVGSLIDALTLKFDGAIFEMVGGSSPHFDVAYKDFEIGEDLKFAQQLQSFLTPKDGNGVSYNPDPDRRHRGRLRNGPRQHRCRRHLVFQRHARRLAGASVHRQRVAVQGLARAAPAAVHDERESVAGSGDFAIFAAPDGIRGFEASFEFGGGASLGFGPLRAQVRVMVGVFVRVLRVDNTNTCTIFGTFFAGGSASIWIFSFSASLYVRLGRSDDGTMYGEAVYSFSFSLEIVDYGYSITAFRREQPIGGGK